MKEETVPKSPNSKQKIKLFCTTFLNKIAHLKLKALCCCILYFFVAMYAPVSH